MLCGKIYSLFCEVLTDIFGLQKSTRFHKLQQEGSEVRMGRPNLEKIERLFEKNEGFSLTVDQYKQKTGTDFPKEKYYAENRSAIAKKAKEYGFEVLVIPHHIEFRKVGEN